MSRWLSSGGFLPLETEDYVLDIMGEPADNFSDAGHPGAGARRSIRKLALRRRLPRAAGDHVAPPCRWRTITSSLGASRWPAISAARRRSASGSASPRPLPGLLASYEPVVSRVRTPRGRRGIYAVRIGADSRAEANQICQRLQSTGGACVVLSNR